MITASIISELDVQVETLKTWRMSMGSLLDSPGDDVMAVLRKIDEAVAIIDHVLAPAAKIEAAAKKSRETAFCRRHELEIVGGP